MFDSKGLITSIRTDLDDNKKLFANHANDMTLADAMVGADVFIGCLLYTSRCV